jgi:hypothetical protein
MHRQTRRCSSEICCNVMQCKHRNKGTCIKKKYLYKNNDKNILKYVHTHIPHIIFSIHKKITARRYVLNANPLSKNTHYFIRMNAMT